MRTLPRCSVVSFAVAAVLSLAIAKGQDNAVQRQLDLVEEFPVASDGDVLLLPVFLEGKRYWFALDTGTEVTVFDTSLPLGAARGKTSADTSSGNKEVGVYNCPRAKVGALDLRAGSPVLGADLEMLRRVSGHDIRGAIGMDFLRHYVIRIDMGLGKVSALRRAGTEAGTTLPLVLQSEGPCVDVKVSGLEGPARFLFDTGATAFGTIRKEYLEQISANGKAKRVGNTLSAELSGSHARESWRIESLSVGGTEHGNVLMQTGDNILGLSFLAGYVATFDFPNRVLYLRKRSEFILPNDFDLSGLHVLRIGGKTIVKAVDENSPASTCGIAPEDELVSVNGSETESLSMLSVRRILCRPDTSVNLVVLRSGKSKEVRLVLPQR